MLRVGDPGWVIRPRPVGTHRTKTWFTPREVVHRIGEDTCCIKVGHRRFRERHEIQFRVRDPISVANTCPWTTPHMRLIRKCQGQAPCTLTGAWFDALSRACLHAYLTVHCSLFPPPGYVHIYVEC